jgi:hypothetical protein
MTAELLVHLWEKLAASEDHRACCVDGDLFIEIKATRIRDGKSVKKSELLEASHGSSK